MIWTSSFWKGAAERAIKTFAQALVGVIGAGAVGVLDVDWLGAASVAALATVVSILTSIGNADFTAGQVQVVVEHDGPPVVVEQHVNTERDVDLSPPARVLSFDEAELEAARRRTNPDLPDPLA